MPLHWTVSHPQRLVIALAKGEVTSIDVSRYFDALVAEKALPYRKIFDVTHSPLSLGNEHVLDMARRTRELAARHVLCPLAIVAASDDAYAKAQLFSAEATAKRPLTIFRELHAARSWLDDHPVPSPES